MSPEPVPRSPRRVSRIPRTEESLLRDRALSAVAEGIVIADARRPDVPLVYVNPGFERITGYSAAEVLGRNCRFLQGAGTQKEALNRLRAAIDEKREVVVELLNYRKDGTPFWNRLSINPVRDSTGAVTHFIGVQSDISEQKTTEEALREAKEDLEEANRRLRWDLEVAAGIQRSLLPVNVPQPAGLSFSWLFRPSAELAGDTLNMFWIDSRHIAVFLVDVSGHGVAAALLSVTLSRWMSTLPGQITLLSQDAASETGYRVARPVEVARRLNEQFPLDVRTAQYFTLIYGLLDVSTREFRYVSAGHPPLIQLGVGRVPRVRKVRGFPIGLFADADYEEHCAQILPGDRLCLFTDGLPEATDPSGEELGEERLANIFQAKAHLQGEAYLQEVVQEVRRWSGNTRFTDDVSAICIEAQ